MLAIFNMQIDPVPQQHRDNSDLARQEDRQQNYKMFTTYSQKSSSKEDFFDKSAAAMWNSGYPATHMFLSNLLRSKWVKRSVLCLLFVAAVFEIAEEFL